MSGHNEKPSIEDVGREAGVSQTTVSFVLSGSKHAERISARTRERVLAAAKRLGYIRSPVGAALQRGYSDTIVLLAVAWDLAIAYSETAVLTSRAAASRGLAVNVQIVDDAKEASLFLTNISSPNPYGLVLLWDSENLPYHDLRNLRSQGLPIVDLMPGSIEDIVSVTADRQQGFCLCTEHLIELGHKRIGMILDTTTRGRTSKQKLAGYRRALGAAGIEFDPGFLEEVTGFGFDSGYKAFASLTGRCPDVTAIMCINDPLALGVMAAARRSGLDVPSDISVTGFGGQKEGTYFSPTLTSVAVPSTRIAEDAIEILIQMRCDPDLRPEPLYFPMELLVRESTGPVRKRTK